MIPKKIILILSVLILSSLACGINVDLPIKTETKTGPTIREDISIPNLEDKNAAPELTLAFGAGELTLSNGETEALIEGVATYNVADLAPSITSDGREIKLSSGSLDIDGIPNFQGKIENKWDLTLSDTPLSLTIKAGAYVGDYQLGGLSLENLTITDGAADVNLDFSQPNKIPMGSFRYETGASNIILSNLSNANVDTMIFQGGAGAFELDFGGELSSDMDVYVESGLSTLTITIPAGTNAEISVEGGLSNISTRGSWEISGHRYSLNGEGPMITITVEMGAGNIILESR